MAEKSQRALYSREMLGLAVELAAFPLDMDAPLRGEARSRACGSVVTVSAHQAVDGSLHDTGLRASSCAVGQAAAALFLRKAEGQDPESLRQVLAQLESWLGADGPMPDWPDIEIIAPARAFPARHGAILLPWQAAIAALSSGQKLG